MTRRSLVVRAAAAAAGAALALLGPGVSAQAPGDRAASRLRDLTSVDQLRDAFNADESKVRVLLLLSPT